MSSIARVQIGVASFLLLGAVTPSSAQSPAPSQRFAYVDSRALLDAVPGSAEAQAKLQKDLNVLEAQVIRMQDSLNAMFAEFQKVRATMTLAAQDKKARDIQEKQGEFQKRSEAITAQVERRKAEVFQPMFDEVKFVLEDVRSSMGLTGIFDVGQNTTLVAIDKNLNITDRVIARLRALPGPATKPDTAKAAVPSPLKAPSGLPVSQPAGVGRPTIPPVRVDTNTTAKSDAM